MNEAEIAKEITSDLQKSPRQVVVYLEGKTDVRLFFGLLGVPAQPALPDTRSIHNDVLVRGLRDEDKSRGSGGKGVETRVSLAAKFGYPGIYGVIDGDGQPLATLALRLDAPYAGPLFCWKAYCIENLLAKTGWPARWGDAPDWPVELLKYTPYVALNRIYRRLQANLLTLGFKNSCGHRLRNRSRHLKTLSRRWMKTSI